MVRGAVALCILFALLGGGISHAAVSHEHGHSHGADESTIWASLHSSLRHEDKQSPAVLVEGTLLVLLAFLSVSLAQFVSRAASSLAAECRDVYARMALRRGIYRYRVVG